MSRRLTLVTDGRGRDLVVPASAVVDEVLRAVQPAAVAGSAYAMASSAGRLLDGADVLAKVTGDGDVLTLVRTGDGGRTTCSPAPIPQGPAGRAGPTADPTAGLALTEGAVLLAGTPTSLSWDAARRPWLSPAVALRALVCALAATVAGELGIALFTRSHPATPTPSVSMAALLLGCGLVLALQRAPDAAGAGSRLAAPLLGVAGGLALPLPHAAGAVGVLAGCVSGAALAGVARVTSPGRDGPSTVAMAAAGIAAGLVAAGLLLSWPGFAAAAVLAGLTPVAVRLLPLLSLSAPDEQLVDVDRLSTTVWSVRAQHAGRRRRLRIEDVERQFLRARDMVSAGTLWAALVAPAGIAVVVATAGRSTASRWGTLAAAVVLALAMGYQSRTVRDRLPRYATLVSAAVLVLEGVWALHALVPTVILLAVAGGVLLVGVLTVCGALALGRGWKSPRLSRIADLLESLSVVLSLPVAIVAADGFEALRRLTSG